MHAWSVHRSLPILVLLLTLAAAGFRAADLARQNETLVGERLDKLADRAVSGTAQSFSRFEYGLRGARGVVIGAGGETIRHSTFRAYSNSRDHDQEFRGSRGFGFIRRVPRAAEDNYLAEMRRGRPDYAIHEFAAHSGERFVIEMVEPEPRNREAVGLDIASEPRRRAAALESMRSGQAVLTAPITLAQASRQAEQGFLFLMPVYREQSPTETAAQREAATIGWSYTPLLIDEVLTDAEWINGQLLLRLTDVTDPTQPIAFFDSNVRHARDVSLPATRRDLHLFGRTWTADVVGTPRFVADLNLRDPLHEAAVIGAIGLLLALLTQGLVRDQQRRTQVQAQRARLAAIVESSDCAIIGQTLDGLVSSWNSSAERMFGRTASEAIGSRFDSLIQSADQPSDPEIPGGSARTGARATLACRRLLHRDGSILDVQVIESPIRNESGKVIGQASTIRDISRPLAMENTFRELMKLTSSEVGRAYLDRASEALCRLLDAELVFIARVPVAEPLQLQVQAAWSPEGRRDLWTQPLGGTPCELIYTPSVRSAEDQILAGGVVVVAAGAKARFESIRGTGYEGFLGLPLHDPAGHLLGHIALFFARALSPWECQRLIDVGPLFSHRVEAELQRLDVEAERDGVLEQLRRLNDSLELQIQARTEEIRRASALQMAVVDNAGYAVMAADCDGIINLYNPAAEALLGYPPEQVLGSLASSAPFIDPASVIEYARSLSEELGVPVRPGLESFVAKSRLGLPDEREWTFIASDGRPIPTMFNVSALRDGYGEITGYLGIAIDLSVRKRLERALTLESNRLRSIFDAAPSAILTISEQGLIETVNDRAEELFGYAEGELPGQSIKLLLTDDPQAAAAGTELQSLSSMLSMNSIPGRTVKARHKDGHEVPVEIRLGTYKGEDGDKVIAIATDRSEQQLLADSESRWRTMANSLPQLVWTCTPRGDCDYLSQQWVEYTGIPAAEQLGFGWVEQVHADDRPLMLDRWQAAVGGLTEFRVEFRIRRADGAYRWFDTRAVPLKDSAGRLLKWIGSNTDIEDRKQAEAQLQDLNTHLEGRVVERTALLEAARRDLQSILDALPSMVGYWDRDQRNRFANHAYQKWFGQAPESIPGKLIREVLGPEIYPRNLPFIEAALRGEPQTFEREIPGPDGRSRHSLAQYLPDIVDGEVRGFYALVHDVTEIRRAQAAAEAASAAKTAFLANMSHEIRTPLHAILGLLQLLMQSRLDAGQRNYASTASTAARTLLGILNDILDFSKIEAGKLTLDVHRFSLDEMLRDVGVLLAASRAGKPIEVVFDIDPAAPQDLIGDELRLKQILINLAGNALKFTERGEVVVAIRAEQVQAHKVRLAFEVRDTGIGLSQAQCSRIFEGFSQAETATTRRYGGTGLGLAISQRLAALMGGQIEVSSEEGKGSRFSFVIDLDRPETRAQSGLEPESGSARKVLLVERQDTSRAVLTEICRGLGWSVTAVPTLDQATLRTEVTDLSASGWSAVILDWPPAAGTDLSALHELQQSGGVRVVGITSDLTQAYQDASDRAVLRADTVLIKPLTASMLFAAVTGQDEYLATRPAEQAARQVPATWSGSARRRDRARLAGLRLLVVEDNATNRFVAEQLLSAEGARVRMVEGGRQAVAAIADPENDFDAVLMDLQMPDVDGFAATQEIRSLPRGAGLPIIAMTANAMRSDREECLRRGMDEHVGKPFELARLIDVIQRCTRGRSSLEYPTAPSLVLEVARSRLGVRSELFSSVIRSFLRDADGLIAIIRQRDPESARAVHTLKGLVGTVGAAELQQAAEQLEQTWQIHGIGTGDQAALDALLIQAERTLAGLAAGLPIEDPSTESVLDEPLEGALARLSALLVASNGEALPWFRRIRHTYGALDPAGFDALGALIDALDFESASIELAALLDRLGETCT